MKQISPKTSIIILMATLALALTGCVRNRSEEPTQPAPQSDTAVESASPTEAPGGQPTTLAIKTPTTAAPQTEATTESAAETTTDTPTEATPTPITSVSAEETTPTGEIIHTVARGETLFSIATRYGVDTNELSRYNSISNPNYIYVGQEIKIPTDGSSAGSISSGGTYTVQAGDTLYSIALKFNTTTQALMSANGLSNPNLIYVGQELSIP